MFNVSILLLDHALKPAMSLTTDTALLCFYMTQSSVGTHLRCGGIFNDSAVTNVFLILKIGSYLMKFRHIKMVPILAYRSICCSTLITGNSVESRITLHFNAFETFSNWTDCRVHVGTQRRQLPL